MRQAQSKLQEAGIQLPGAAQPAAGSHLQQQQPGVSASAPSPQGPGAEAGVGAGTGTLSSAGWDTAAQTHHQAQHGSESGLGAPGPSRPDASALSGLLSPALAGGLRSGLGFGDLGPAAPQGPGTPAAGAPSAGTSGYLRGSSTGGSGGGAIGGGAAGAGPEEFRALLRHEQEITRLKAQNRALRRAVCKLDKRCVSKGGGVSRRDDVRKARGGNGWLVWRGGLSWAGVRQDVNKIARQVCIWGRERARHYCFPHRQPCI